MILPTLHNSNTFPAAFNCFDFNSRGIRGYTNGSRLDVSHNNILIIFGAVTWEISNNEPYISSPAQVV
jgi:hypothetical protein